MRDCHSIVGLYTYQNRVPFAPSLRWVSCKERDRLPHEGANFHSSFVHYVHVRIKNKGSQAHKKGPKRPKYQSPWAEHPETNRMIAEADIHANHAEAFFSSLRRKCATFRRKTNMYAKSTKGLQRLLHVYWVVHNFLRVHFTTREVPAVALGVIERRLSAGEIFHMQMA